MTSERPRPLMSRKPTGKRDNFMMIDSHKRLQDQEYLALSNIVRFGHDVASKLAADIALFRKNGAGPSSLPHPDTYFIGVEGGGPFFKDDRPAGSFVHNQFASGYRYLKNYQLLNAEVINDAEISVNSGVPYGASASVRRSLTTVGRHAHASSAPEHKTSFFDLITPNATTTTIEAPTNGTPIVTTGNKPARALSVGPPPATFRYPVLSDRPSFDEALMISNKTSQERLYYEVLLPAMMGVEGGEEGGIKSEAIHLAATDDFVAVSPLTPAVVLSSSPLSVPALGDTDTPVPAWSISPLTPGASPFTANLASSLRPHSAGQTHHNPHRNLHLLPNVPSQLNLEGPNGVLFLPSPVPLRTSLYEVPVKTLEVRSSHFSEVDATNTTTGTTFSIHHQASADQPFSSRAISSTPLVPGSANAVVANGLSTQRNVQSSAERRRGVSTSRGHSLSPSRPPQISMHQQNYFTDPNKSAITIESGTAFPQDDTSSIQRPMATTVRPTSARHPKSWNASTLVGYSAEGTGMIDPLKGDGLERSPPHTRPNLVSPVEDESLTNRHYVDLSLTSRKRNAALHQNESKLTTSPGGGEPYRLAFGNEGKAHLAAMLSGSRMREDVSKALQKSRTTLLKFGSDEEYSRYYLQALNIAPLLEVKIPFASAKSSASSKTSATSSQGGVIGNPPGVDGHPIANGHIVWALLRIVYFSLVEVLEGQAGTVFESQLVSLFEMFDINYKSLWSSHQNGKGVVEGEGARIGDLSSIAANTTNNTSSTTRKVNGSNTLSKRPMSLLERQQAVLKHISNSASAISSLIPQARRASDLIKRHSNSGTVHSAVHSVAAYATAADEETPYGTRLAAMWGIVAELLATFFVVSDEDSKSLTGERVLGIRKVLKENYHNDKSDSLQSKTVNHSVKTTSANGKSTLRSATILPQVSYNTSQAVALESAVCQFLLELQVLPEPSSVPALRALIASKTQKGEVKTNAGKSDQKVFEAITDPLKAPYIPEACAYSGLSSAVALNKAGAGSLTPGVTGERLKKRNNAGGWVHQRSASVDSHATATSSAPFSASDSAAPFSYTGGERSSTTSSRTTTLKAPTTFVPRSTPFSSILDPTVFPFIRNGTLLCDIAAKLCGGGGGVDMGALLTYLSTGTEEKGASSRNNGYLFEETRLTTITKSSSVDASKLFKNGFRRSASASNDSSHILGTFRHELTNARLSLSSFTRNPKIPSACMTNIVLAQTLLSALTKASVAKRAGIVGFIPLGYRSGGTNISDTSSSVVDGHTTSSTSAIYKQQLNGSVAGGNLSLVTSSQQQSKSPATAPLLAPYCLADPMPIYNGDVSFILGLLEDLMRYTYGAIPRGKMLLMKGSSGVIVEELPFIPPHFSRHTSEVPQNFLAPPEPLVSSIYKPTPAPKINGAAHSSPYRNTSASVDSFTVHHVDPISFVSFARDQISFAEANRKANDKNSFSTSPNHPQIQSPQKVRGGSPRPVSDVLQQSAPPQTKVIQQTNATTISNASAATSQQPPHQKSRGDSFGSNNTPPQPQHQHGLGGVIIDTVANPHMAYLSTISPPTDRECGELGHWLVRKLGPKYKHVAADGSFEVDFASLSAGGPDPYRSVLLNPLWFSGGTCHTGAQLNGTQTQSNPQLSQGIPSSASVSNRRGMGKCWLLSDGIVLADLAKVLTGHNSSKFSSMRVDGKATAMAAKRNNVRRVIEFFASDGKLGAGKNGIRTGGGATGGAESDPGDDGTDSRNGAELSATQQLLSSHPHSIVSALALDEAIVAGDLRAVVMVLRELRVAYRGHLDRRNSSLMANQAKQQHEHASKGQSEYSATIYKASGGHVTTSYSYASTATTLTSRAVDMTATTGAQHHLSRTSSSMYNVPLAAGQSGMTGHTHPFPNHGLPSYEVRGPNYPSNISTPMRNWF